MKRLILGSVARLDGALTHALLHHSWRLLGGRDRWWSGAVQAAATRAVIGGAPTPRADAGASGGLAHHEFGRQRDGRGRLAAHEAEQQPDHLGADPGERLADSGERRL